MRQIKFRAQDIASNKWLYGDLRHHKHDVCIFDAGGTKDIYEGDILEVNYADEDNYLEVRFVRGVFAFLWNGDLDDEFPCNAPTHEWAKVIGNIYDDPELIKRH